MWSDETKIKLLGCHNTHHAGRTDGTAFDPKNAIPRVKFGSGEHYVVGLFFSIEY